MGVPESAGSRAPGHGQKDKQAWRISILTPQDIAAREAGPTDA